MGDKKFSMGYKSPEWFINGEIAIKINGKYVPIHLKEKYESHTERVWIFFDEFPDKPVKITLNKERNGFLKVLDVIKDLYLETHSKSKKK